jgi:ABC-type nickel/cobalt efflux system permease component RcnA
MPLYTSIGHSLRLLLNARAINQILRVLSTALLEMSSLTLMYVHPQNKKQKTEHKTQKTKNKKQNTKTQKHKNTKTQKHKNTKTQTKTQKHKNKNKNKKIKNTQATG